MVLCDISAEFYFKFIIIKLLLGTVIVQSLLSNTCYLLSGIFEVFNEMEINIVNNEIFTKLYLQIRVRGKEIS